MATSRAITDAQFRQAAKAQYHDTGTIEIDDRAVVSRNVDGDDGAYVQAWVWVPNASARHVQSNEKTKGCRG